MFNNVDELAVAIANMLAKAGMFPEEVSDKMASDFVRPFVEHGLLRTRTVIESKEWGKDIRRKMYALQEQQVA